VSGLRELSTDEAQSWFDAMPRVQRLCSLSPGFARADLSRSPGLRCVHVGFEQAGTRWLHSIHLRPVADAGWAAISPYGYGGPLCDRPDAAFLSAAWAAYTGWARAQRILGEFCRFHPEAAGHEMFFGGAVRPNRATISVDLTVVPVESQYNTLARRKLRKAAMTVRWSHEARDWRAFGPFYRRAMLAMGAHERYHFSDAYFSAIAAVPGAELCICADGPEWLSAGVYLFQQRGAHDVEVGGTLEYHLGASSSRGHATGAAYLLQHAAAQEGQRRGLANLYLGGGTTAEPDNPLLFYKRAFSRRERIFHVGNAVHHEPLFAGFARSRGYDRDSAPPNLLFD
jgi:hypothetical protein